MEQEVSLNSLKKDIRSKASKSKAIFAQRFFKTGKGEYAEGDVFLGLTVPEIRTIVQKYYQISLSDSERLLKSPIHEERMAALLIFIEKFKKGDDKLKKQIFELYCSNTKYINNWDLIDLSAEKIIGSYLWQQPVVLRKLLYRFSKSSDLWQKRISIMSTYYFIKNNFFDDTLKIAAVLLNDKHDLIHKAVGWMLREVGKRDLAEEEAFLKKCYKAMPRTMLRYAIERFPEKKRKDYLLGKI